MIEQGACAPIWRAETAPIDATSSAVMKELDLTLSSKFRFKRWKGQF